MSQDPSALLEDTPMDEERTDSRASTATPELTDQVEAQQQNNHPVPQLQQYDPRALLNPKSISKRPAAEEQAVRGREDAAFAGQVSLVERLHNVHERTESPSKRVKTDDERKSKSHSNVGSGGALDLKPNGDRSTPIPSHSAIDLTMSKSNETSHRYRG